MSSKQMTMTTPQTIHSSTYNTMNAIPKHSTEPMPMMPDNPLAHTSENSPRERQRDSPPSICRLLALHPRERLLVHPLLWQERQLSLLRCHFSTDAPEGVDTA